MKSIEKRCSMHVNVRDKLSGWAKILQCQNRAKFLTPDKKLVCGIHKNAINKMMAKLDRSERCTKIINLQKEFEKVLKISKINSENIKILQDLSKN